MTEEADQLRALMRRLDDLEYKLAEHSRALNFAIDQRDQLALNAAWGPVKAAAGLLAFGGSFYVAESWLGLSGLVSFVVGCVLAFLAMMLLGKKVLEGEEQDQKNLRALPEWRERAWNAND